MMEKVCVLHKTIVSEVDSYDPCPGLWYTREYPEERWIEGLAIITQRYLANPWVAGMDLRSTQETENNSIYRNEIRPSHEVAATWGTDIPETDWAAAAERAGQGDI